MESYVRECAGEKLVPATASMSSALDGIFHAEKCIDGDEEGSLCITQKETAPWLALDYGSEVNVRSVVLIAHTGDVSTFNASTKNVNIRVSSTPPVSGSEMFTGGQLLGTFEGPATSGQRIEVTGGTELTGRYVVVQMNHTSGANYLELQEVTSCANSVCPVIGELS